MYTINPDDWSETMTATVKVVMMTMCMGSALHAEWTEWQAWLDAKAASCSGVTLVGRCDAGAVVAAYGIADRGTARANTADTRFSLGSINETFTAIAIAQLLQRGRLSVDASLAKI